MSPTLFIKKSEDIDSANTVLLMTAGEKHLCYALLNNLSKEITEFGYYALQKESDLTTIFEENKKITAQYLDFVIAFHVSASVFIPAAFYQAENAEINHDVIFGDTQDSVFLTEHLPAWNIYHVYKVPLLLHAQVIKRSMGKKIHNIHSVLIDKFSGEKEEAMLLDLRRDEYSVIVFKNNLLQLVQVFTYASPEDVLYSLLKICRQLNLSQQEVKITIAGLIEKDSAIYREMNKYFIHLGFEGLTASVKIADELKDYPQHYYSTICKLATCV